MEERENERVLETDIQSESELEMRMRKREREKGVMSANMKVMRAPNKSFQQEAFEVVELVST